MPTIPDLLRYIHHLISDKLPKFSSIIRPKVNTLIGKYEGPRSGAWSLRTCDESHHSQWKSNRGIGVLFLVELTQTLISKVSLRTEIYHMIVCQKSSQSGFPRDRRGGTRFLRLDEKHNPWMAGWCASLLMKKAPLLQKVFLRAIRTHMRNMAYCQDD